MRKWRNIAAGICFALAVLLIANHVFDLQGRFNEWRYLPKAPAEVSSALAPESAAPAADDPRIVELRRWQGANDEVVGWIDIPDCLAQPVVQGKNNEFYLDHDATRAYNRNGGCFLDYEVPEREADNLVVYGHNMENAQAFSNLNSYMNKAYAEAHKTLSYTNGKEDFAGEVVAVVLMNLQDERQYVPFNTHLRWDKEMNARRYLDELEKVTLFRLGEVKKGDRLLTMSTCDNRQADARILVIAKLTPQAAKAA